jgi:hypothetical protein
LEINMTVRHVFSWQVAPGHSGDKIVQLLNTLPEKLPQVKGWEIGQHHGDPGENGSPWDGVLVSDFDSWAELESYSNDPQHLEVVEQLMPMFADRAVVDFERQGS